MSRWLRLLLAGSLAMGAGCSRDEPAPAGAVVVSMSAPAEVVAGAAIDLEVMTEGAGQVTLEIVDAFASTFIEIDTADRTTAFRVPERLVTASGTIGFRVRGADGTSAATSTEVRPSSPVSVDIRVGPTTVIADGRDRTMAVALAVDRFGNPIADGGEVRFTSVDGGDVRREGSSPVAGGLAALVIESDTAAGRVEVFAGTDGDVVSRPVAYTEHAGQIASIELIPPEPTMVADGRTIVEIETSVLTDSFGNVVGDGRRVELAIEGPDGIGIATAKTIGGTARFDVVAPARPGALTLEAISAAARSTPVTLAAVPAVSSLPVRVVATSASDPGESPVVLSIGPVRNSAGALIAAGHEVTVDVDGQTVAQALVDGRAEITLPALPPGTPITVSVLGVNVEVNAR